jgi:hypothetical protein
MPLSYTARTGYLQIMQGSKGQPSLGGAWGVPTNLFFLGWGVEETRLENTKRADRGVIYVRRAEASNSTNQ